MTEIQENKNLEELWKTALGEIELQVSKPNFLTWFRGTKILSRDDKIRGVIVGLPNNFTREWIKSRYHKLILSSLRNIDSSIKNIEYIVESKNLQDGGEREKKLEAAAETAESMQQPLIETKIDPNTNLNPRYSLDGFIVGSSNELAYAAIQAVVREVGKKYNPLFIYGGVGLGKTHLIQAAGNEIKKKYQNKIKVLYIPSERFINDVVWAVRNRRMEDIKRKYRDIDVLIIDDIQFIGGKETTELEFFYTFNSLYENNKQIIISSDRPPAAIPTLEERLKSRFEGGMIADITYPDYEMRLIILREGARASGCEIESKILETIANKVQKNIRELQGTLNKVIFYQTVKKEVIDFKKLDSIINENIQVSTKNVTANDILKAVSAFFEVPLPDLLGKGRRREVVEPRQISIYLLRELLGMSYTFIGGKLGKRDHTTAIHAYEKISRELISAPSLNQKIMMIKEMIYK